MEEEEEQDPNQRIPSPRAVNPNYSRPQGSPEDQLKALLREQNEAAERYLSEQKS